MAEAKSIKTEPGEVTSPSHINIKKDEGSKRDRESQVVNDSDEEEDDEEEEDGDLLDDDEVKPIRLPYNFQAFMNFFSTLQINCNFYCLLLDCSLFLNIIVHI